MLQKQNCPGRNYSGYTLVLVPLALLSAVYLYQPFRTQARLLISHGTAQSKPATDQTSTIEAATRHSTASITQEKAGDVYGRLPLSFAANRGQADSQVQFLARGAGYNLFLTSAGAVLTLHKRESRRQETMAHRGSLRDSVAVLSMKFVGGNTNLQAEGIDELSGKTNYYVGSDPSRWQADVPNYSRIRYQSIYPGVNLEYYGNQNRLEYDLVIAPGADPRLIKLSFEGARSIAISAQGDLVLHTAKGDVRQVRPLIYQASNGVRREIRGRYVLKGKRAIGFEVGSYDASAPLVIDPVLSYSSYLGGSSTDAAYGIAVDSLGNAYITGETYSTNFPGTFNPVYIFHEAFVSKLNPTGSAFIYSTYLGGSGNEVANRIAVDSAGNAYVVGTTDSDNFTVTAGCYQNMPKGATDAFVTKFNSTGSIVYSTYLGGNGSDYGRGIATDSAGNAYITGATYSTTFPVTAGAFQMLKAGDGDVFVTKLNAAGSALVYSTYLGGTGTDEGYAVAADSSGNAYVTGETRSTSFPKTMGAFQTSLGSSSYDAFITKVNSSGTSLVYSTFLGGISDDHGYDIALDSSTNAYVTGETLSNNFPVTAGAYQTTYVFDQAFITKLNAAGSALGYSTYIGGTSTEVGRGIAVDLSGNAYLAGSTFSNNFPKVHQIPQPNADFGNGYDAFVVKMNAAGSRPFYSTYFGGSQTDFGRAIALDAAGSAYLTGSTASTNFTTLNPLQAANADGGSFTDGFVTKIALSHYTISGRVTHGSGGGVGGVSLSLTGSQSMTTQTNGNGEYAFAGLEEGGAYVVTPSNAGFAFTPPNLSISDLSSNQAVDFVQNDVLVTVQTSPSGRTFTVDGTSYGTTQSFYWLTGSSHSIGTTSPQTGGTGTQYTWNNWSDGGAISHNVAPVGNTTYTATFTTPLGKSKTGVFRPSTGELFLKNSNSSGFADTYIIFGNPGDYPLAGDWNGDGTNSVGIYRNGVFYLRNTNSTGFADIVVPFGSAGDQPIAGDWNGDGVDTIGIYRNGTFYLRNSNTAGSPDLVFTLGNPGDVGIAGDWNGDGVTSCGVFRPSNGIVYLKNSNTTGFADLSFVFGNAGDKPVAGDWNGDGIDTIGIYRNGVFYLSNSNATGFADTSFVLGNSGDFPIAGNWNGSP